MSDLPDIREPIIEILKLMEEEPDNFFEFLSDINYKPPNCNSPIFEIKTKGCFIDNIDGVEHIEFNTTSVVKDKITNLTKDESSMLIESAKELCEYCDKKREEEQEKREEENRESLSNILVKLRKKKCK